MNDVRRGTRELLARIRQERIDRADKASQPLVVLTPEQSEPPAPSTGLMPDPTITRISEQLVARGLAPRVADDHAAAAAASADAVASAPPVARSGRISRQYDSTKLAISPLHPEDATLTLDLSAARPPATATATQQRFAKLAGLQPFAPAQRRDAAAESTAIAARAPAPAAAVDRPMPKIDTVPTLGPGLIWRLSQAGIVTMADLASADAATIRAKLGQVGRLVKVEDWIAHARAVVSGEELGSVLSACPSRTAAPTLCRAVCFGRIGAGGASALTDDGLGAAASMVSVAVMVRDDWFVALLEGAPHLVTTLLGKLIIHPQLGETTLCTWDSLDLRSLSKAGVELAVSGDDVAGDFDPRGHSAVSLIEMVLMALAKA